MLSPKKRFIGRDGLLQRWRKVRPSTTQHRLLLDTVGLLAVNCGQVAGLADPMHGAHLAPAAARQAAMTLGEHQEQRERHGRLEARPQTPPGGGP